MLTLTIPGYEQYDESSNEFTYSQPVTLDFEHSLATISKWEAKWHKPFVNPNGSRTKEETLDYIRCMCITPPADDMVLKLIDEESIEIITDYISNPMTATTISGSNSTSREIVTAEVIYANMIILNIPFECQHWHFNTLTTLIAVCAEKRGQEKLMSESEILKQNEEINNARKAKHKTRG